MVLDVKKRSYGSVFVFYFFCFVLVAEGVRFDILTEAVAEAVLEGTQYVPEKLEDKTVLSAAIAEWRERPPSTYAVKFQSFPALVKMFKDGYYESLPFTVGGYNWTFLVYPNGSKRFNKDNGRISLSVKIDNSSLINDPKDVYAEVKFFTYDRMFNKYYAQGVTEARKFHLSDTEWGVQTFTTAGTLLPERGYLFDGEQYMVGVDVFVAQPFTKWEFFSFNENIPNPIYTWRITGFSTRYADSYTSDPFSSGGTNWALKVYPNGDGYGTGNSLSLYLLSESGRKVYVRAKLRVFNQINSNHVEKLVEGWPNAITNNGWGFQKFIPISDLNNPSKGYLVNDELVVEVEIISFSKTDQFSKA